jgi:hypothetical protein
MRDDLPQATVRFVDGKPVLDDPMAEAVVRVVEARNKEIARKNCFELFKLNAERVRYFEQRAHTLGRLPEDVMIVVIQVDDTFGGPIAEALMPGMNWQPIRDEGKMPVARGLAERKGIQRILDGVSFAAEEARRLRTLEGYAVLVVGYETLSVFSAEDAYSG